MVWSSASHDTRTGLHFFDTVSMNASMYIECFDVYRRHPSKLSRALHAICEC